MTETGGVVQGFKKGVDYPGVTVVFYCHDGEGNVLLNRRSANCRDEHGRWDIGGGGVELGATIEQTLRDEIFQEYLTNVLEFESLGVRELHREHEGQKTHWIALDYKVLVVPHLAGNGEPRKFDKVEWFTLRTLPENMHSQWPAFLEKYMHRLTV